MFFWSSEPEEHKCEDEPETTGPFIPLAEIKKFDPAVQEKSWEDYVIHRWTIGRCKDGENEGVPEEYASASLRICLADDLMRNSRIARTLQHLEALRGRPFRGSTIDVLADYYEVFEPCLLLALKKAFGLRTDIAARNESRPIPEVANFTGNFLDAATKMWSELPLWKKPVLSAALRELIISEDPTGLQVLLGFMKASVNHCNAGKVSVWNTILLSVLPSSRHVAPEKRKINERRQALWDEAMVWCDDWKEKAFRSTFIEPTKMYYTACDEQELVDNVDVHGSSVFLAVLLSTLGVRIGRQPFLMDYPLSAVSFIGALDEDQLAVLWKQENFGKSFVSIPECCEPKVVSQVNNHYSNFIFNGLRPWQIANSAIDPTTPVERRLQLRPYLEQFAAYFSAELVVPNLVSFLLQNDQTRILLQSELEQLLGNETDSAADDNSEDVRTWLWDLEELPAVLRFDRAERLLQSVGLLKSSGHLRTQGSSSASTSPLLILANSLASSSES